MTDKRGVFSISDISDLQLSGSLGINDTWVASSGLDLGYFIGGFPSPNNTLVERIDYSNDSNNAAVRGFLPAALNKSDSHGNDNFAYVTGSQSPGYSSKVYRLDYFNDGTAPVHKGNMPNAFFGYSAVGNQNYAYFCAGWNQSAARSDIDRVDFTNDTATASPKGTLSANKTVTGTGASSNNNYGWVCDGGPSSPGSRVDRIDFANDTATASLRGPLARGGTENISASGNNSYGWYYGGKGSGQPNTTYRERIDYSNDTATSTPRGNLSTASAGTGSHGNQSYGYTGGNSPSATSSIERTDYANDTSTGANVSYLTTTNSGLCGVSGKEDGTNERGITQYPYATGFERAVDTDSQITKSFLNAANGGFGYHTGGIRPYSPANPSGGYNETNTNRIDYSNDTATTSSKAQVSISPAQMYGAGPLSSPSHGYLVGGGGATYSSWATPSGGTASTETSFTSVQRMDYSNDGNSFVTMAANTSDAKNTFGTVSNANYGYLAGGTPGTFVSPSGSFTSYINRYDFANDTLIDLGVHLPTTTRGGAGVGNQDYGYFCCGGKTANMTGDYLSSSIRIDYSNDSAGVTAKGNNPIKLSQTTGTSNKDYGYLLGGNRVPKQNQSPDNGRSQVSRIDFANDTNALVDKGTFPAWIYGNSASGNANFGYAVAGYQDGYPLKSTIYRINYANDTATPVVKGKTADEQGYAAGHGPQDYAKPLFSGFGLSYTSWPNPNPSYQAAPSYGYSIGGWPNPSLSPSSRTPAQRIDFTNDTATAVVKADPGTPSFPYVSCVGNRDYGYSTQGGANAGQSTQRLDYASDSTTMLSKAPRYTYFQNPSTGANTGSVGGYNEAAVGNRNYGYFNGGYKLYSVPTPTGVCPGGYVVGFSHIDRLDYSNDSSNTLRRSYNTTRTGEGGASGTDSYGYWMGGGDNWCSYSDTSTIVERTDYSNDTSNSVGKGNLNTAQYRNRCIGNINYGWTTGGSPGPLSQVNRLDYSNDTTNATPKGNLSISRYLHTTTGNEDYGYAASGPTSPTTTERIDYSNDTATASPKGNLTYNNSYGDGVSAGENGLPYG